MKRFFSVFIALIITFSLAVPVLGASNKTAEEAANVLYNLGLFNGIGTKKDGTPDFGLERKPTRQEAVTMLVGLLGKREEAAGKTWSIPFKDVDAWAVPYVGYAYNNGLTSGISEVAFGGNGLISASQYITYVLRALGYEVGVDFKWDKAWELSDIIGLTDGQYNSSATEFLRSDIVLISERALGIKMKGSEKTLYEHIQGQADNVFSSADVITLDEIMEEMNEQHRVLNEGSGDFDGLEAYLIDDKSTAKLITSGEANVLFKNRPIAKTVTQQQALEDIDILFRAFKSTYGAYYYFGEEKFEAAKAELTNWVSEQNAIKGTEFNKAVGKAFTFLKDAHTDIGEKSRDKILRYKYYYFDDQIYSKDDKGYYKMIGNEKWYFKSFTDSRVRMEYTLTLTGELAYSPVLFCPEPEMKMSEVILETEYGKTMTQALKCKLAYPKVVDDNAPVFSQFEENGIVYLSVLDFQRENESKLQKFVGSGTDVKDAKLIIFDLRTNGGGESRYSNSWVKNFTGEEPSVPQIHATRHSLLNERDGTSGPNGAGAHGTFDHVETKGKFIENDIPIIVLMDDECGSAGESALQYLRSMENVLVVGSNSAGYQISSTAVHLFLPNTGIRTDIGTTLRLFYSCDNVDFEGYEPDVWCNPERALDSVLNMLLRYDKIDMDTWNALRDKI